MQQITFALAAVDTKAFDISGTYFEIIDATGGVVSVNFSDSHGSRTKDGELLSVLSGTFLKFPGKGYSRFEVSNASGLPNTVTILYGFGEGGTRRSSGNVTISGNVSTMERDRAKTQLGEPFFSWIDQAGGGAQNAFVQLWNPVGSGKNLYVKRCSFNFNAPDVAHCAVTSTQAGSLGVHGNPSSYKRDASPAATVAECRQSNALAVAGYLPCRVLTIPTANIDREVTFPNPMLIGPGFGFVVRVAGAGATGIGACNIDHEEAAPAS